MKRESGIRFLIALLTGALGLGAGVFIGTPTQNTEAALSDSGDGQTTRATSRLRNTRSQNTSSPRATSEDDSPMLAQAGSTQAQSQAQTRATACVNDTELRAAFSALGVSPEELVELAGAGAEASEGEGQGQDAEQLPALSDLVAEASLNSQEQRELHSIVTDLHNELRDRMGTWEEIEAEMEAEATGETSTEAYTSATVVTEINEQIGVLQAMRDAQTRVNELLGPARVAELRPELADVSLLIGENGPDLRGI